MKTRRKQIARTMTTPAKKSEVLVHLMDNIAQLSFGRTRSQAFGPGGKCVTCGSNKIAQEDFKDDLSRKEFTISGMCQVCQDATFGEGP